MKYRIWKKQRELRSDVFMVVRKKNFISQWEGLTDDKVWRELGWATKFPHEFNTLGDAQQYIHNAQNTKMGWIEITDEEIALKNLKQ